MTTSVVFLGTDEDEAARSLRALRSSNIIVTRARNEQEALSECNEQRVPVLVVEIDSARPCALQTVEQAAHSGVTVIVIGDEFMALAAVQHGAWDYVLRDDPDRIRHLSIRIEQALEVRRLRQEGGWGKHAGNRPSRQDNGATDLAVTADFVSAIGHELKNPVAALLGYSQILADEGRADPRLTEIAERLEANSQKLLEIVDNMLDVFRGQTGNLRITPVATDLNVLVRTAIDKVMSNRLDQRLVEFVPAALLPTMSLDRNRLARMTSALLSFVSGSIPPDGSVRVSTALDGNEVTLRIAGGAEGAPAGTGHRPRDPVLESSSAVTVAASRAIIGAHGGKVDVECLSSDFVSLVVRFPILERNQPAGWRSALPSLDSHPAHRKSG